MQHCCLWKLGEIFLVPVLLGTNLGKGWLRLETPVKSLCVCLASA